MHWDYMAIEAYEEHLRRTQPHRVNWFLSLHPEDQMRLCGGWYDNSQYGKDAGEEGERLGGPGR